MYSNLFSIGPFTIHSFGVMIAVGMIAAYAVFYVRARRMGIDIRDSDTMVLTILTGGILGAKILYWFTQIEFLIHNPRLLLDMTSGFVVYGGIIGGIAAGFLYCKIKKLSFPQYFDLVIPSVALAQSFGRIGCFLAGCCYGRETTSRLGVRFPVGSLAPADCYLFPTQLMSGGLDFLLFVILIGYAPKKHTDGQVAALYMILYSLGRFVLEWYRGDAERGNVGVFSTSQFISIFILILSGIAIVVMQSRAKHI